MSSCIVAMIGFLSHSGFAHGGNGYEGSGEQFRDSGLGDPGDQGHGIDLKALAARYVADYASYKSSKRSAGSLDIQKIPGINHPVFRNKPVNYDPREVWIHDLVTQRGEYNVFHEYYHELRGVVQRRGIAQRLLRQHRRGDLGHASEGAMAKVPQRATER
jgi:hypothetical protein